MAAHPGQAMTPEQHLHMMNQMMLGDQMGFEALMTSCAAASRAARTAGSAASANRRSTGNQSHAPAGPTQSGQQQLSQNLTSKQARASSQKPRSRLA